MSWDINLRLPSKKIQSPAPTPSPFRPVVWPRLIWATWHEAQPSGLGFQFHPIQVTLISIGSIAGPQGILQQVPGPWPSWAILQGLVNVLFWGFWTSLEKVFDGDYIPNSWCSIRTFTNPCPGCPFSGENSLKSSWIGWREKQLQEKASLLNGKIYGFHWFPVNCPLNQSID